MAMAIVLFVVVLGLPQAVGFMAARARRGWWEWPVVAAAFFATGWYLLWAGPWSQSEQAHSRCGAAGAVFMLALFVLTPLHAILGLVLGAVFEDVAPAAPQFPEAGHDTLARGEAPPR
jgi:hypothetical protein